MTTNEPSTSTAVAEHEAGRLDRAESIYRARLSQYPDDLATIIGLGDVLTDAGQLTEAEEFYRRAIALDGESPAAAGAYDGLAAIRQDLGDLENAIPASKMAAQLRGNADDSFGVGNTLEYLGRTVDAIDMFVLATEQRPGFIQAHMKAAQHLLAAGRAGESIPHYQAAVEANPEVAELHCNLANAAQRVGRIDEALNSIRRAIELNPKLAEAHVIMGTIWQDRRRPSDALECYKRALSINPNIPEAMNSVAALIEHAGQVESAGQMYARAVQLKPDSIQFHENLGINLLLRGDFNRGWAEYDWRRLKLKNPGSRPFPQPAWDGSNLQGRRIMLFAEQGFGDTIQFLRYAKLVSQLGGHVMIECQPQLVSIARQVSGVAEVIAQGDPWPDCHAQLALMSVPMVLRTDLSSIPAEVPYIRGDDYKVAMWKQKLAECTGKRIGLVWAGSTIHKNDKNRSMPVGRLSPLAEVPGISFISLQKDLRSAPPDNLKLMDLTGDLADFSDTAALIANLDLVITVDTAVAHLAGAMGKPVWILLPALPDWRWMLGREDSPWYPSARLFRQETPGDWGGVVRRVCDALNSNDEIRSRRMNDE